MKEQHEGKNILSPERKVARKEFENKYEAEEIKGDTITIPRKELENLKDLVHSLEKENSQLKQETKYLKSENYKANEHINKLDSVYQKQVTDLKKKTVEQKDVEMKIVKDQLEKHLKVKPAGETEQEVAIDGIKEYNHAVTYTIKYRE